MAEVMPWEEYASPAEEKGPWDEFAPPATEKVKRTREQVEASIPNRPVEEMSTMEKVGSALYAPVRALSLQDMPALVSKGITSGFNALDYVGRKAMGLPTELPKPFVIDRNANTLNQEPGMEPVRTWQEGKPILDVNLPNADINPLDAVIKQTIEGTLTPEGLATLPLMGAPGMVGKGAQAFYLGQMAPATVEAGGRVFEPGATPGERTQAALEMGRNLLFSLGLGKGVTEPVPPAYAPRPGEAGQIPEMRRFEDRPEFAETIPVERQIPETAEALMEQRVNPPPIDLSHQGEGQSHYNLPGPAGVRQAPFNQVLLPEQAEALTERMVQEAQNPPVNVIPTHTGEGEPIHVTPPPEEPNASTIRSNQEGVSEARLQRGPSTGARGEDLQLQQETGGAGSAPREVQAQGQEAYNVRLDPDAVMKMGAEEFMEKMSGFTNDAFKVGEMARGNPEMIAKLEKYAKQSKVQFENALAQGKLEEATTLSVKPQYFNEALQKARETPEAPPTPKLYANPIFDPDFYKQLGQGAKVIKEEANKVRADVNQWIDGKVGGKRPVGWSPYWTATKEQRKAALLGAGPSNKLEIPERVRAQPGESTTAMQDISNVSVPLRKAIQVADKNTFTKDTIFDYLDAGKAQYKGPLFQHVVWPIDDSFNAKTHLVDSYVNPIANLKKSYKLGEKEGERIGVYLMAKQEGGVERLVASGVEPGTIKKILGSMKEGEVKTAEAMRKQLDATFPLVQKLAKELYNKDVTPVDNYFSWQRDWSRYDKKPEDLTKPTVDAGTLDWLTEAYPVKGAKTEQGFTIERKPGATSPIQVDAFKVYDRHMRDVAHFLALQKQLKEIGEVVRDPKFAQKYGKMGQEMVMDWLNNVARQGRYPNKMQWMDALRKRVGVGVIAYRLGSQFVHLANVPLAMQRAGTVWWGRGLNEAMGDTGRAFLKEHFAETFERGGGEPALYELETSPVEHKTVAKTGYNKAVEGGFYFQRQIDKLNTQATVLGIYMRKLAEKGLDPSRYAELPVDKQAIAEARVLSRRAVASPLYKDVPMALTKGSLNKLIFQFQNTFLDQWSNIRYDLPQYLRNDPKQAMGLMAAIAGMLLVETGVKYGAKQTKHAVTGYTPKSEDEGEFTRMLTHEMEKRVPGMGQLMTQVTYGGTGVPALDVAKDVVQSGTKVVGAEDRKTRNLAMVKGVTAAGELAGVPGSSYLGEIAQDVMKGKYFKTHEQKATEKAKELFGNKETYNLSERVKAERELKKTKEPMTRNEEAGAGRASIKSEAERGARVEEQLDEQAKTFLSRYALRLPGHGDTVNVGKQNVVLSKKEMETYEKFLLEGYKQRIDVLSKAPNFGRLPQTGQQDLFQRQMTIAAQVARAKMVKELASRR